MICDCFSSLFFSAARQWTDNIIHIPKTTNIHASNTIDFFLLLSIILFSTNYRVTTRHKSNGKMHCLFRQCILNVATGCHFTDPIALRLSLSTDLPANLLFVLYCTFFSLKLSIINTSSLLAQEYSYQQALQHEHSFQQKEPLVYLLRKHWQSSQ